MKARNVIARATARKAPLNPPQMGGEREASYGLLRYRSR